MGSDKALVELHGLPMVLHIAAALRAGGCGRVVAIGGDRAALEALGVAVVDDEHPGEGPLGGVITALGAADPGAAAVMVVACDLPLLTPHSVGAVAAALGDAQVSVAVAGRRQPVCAVWRRSALPTLRALFAAGERSLAAAFAVLQFVEVPVDPQELTNVNTPRDLPQ